MAGSGRLWHWQRYKTRHNNTARLTERSHHTDEQGQAVLDKGNTTSVETGYTALDWGGAASQSMRFYSEDKSFFIWEGWLEKMNESFKKVERLAIERSTYPAIQRFYVTLLSGRFPVRAQSIALNEEDF